MPRPSHSSVPRQHKTGCTRAGVEVVSDGKLLTCARCLATGCQGHHTALCLGSTRLVVKKDGVEGMRDGCDG
eukprot:1155444-Pelagomonas_calceolata.AAC.3